MRRSAVRNMVNRGISEGVAMSMTAHKSLAVFDRYHIVSPTGLKVAAQKLAGTFPCTAGTIEAHSIDAAFASMQ